MLISLQLTFLIKQIDNNIDSIYRLQPILKKNLISKKTKILKNRGCIRQSLSNECNKTQIGKMVKSNKYSISTDTEIVEKLSLSSHDFDSRLYIMNEAQHRNKIIEGLYKIKNTIIRIFPTKFKNINILLKRRFKDEVQR